MKTLNKYMVNHVASLLLCMSNGDWLKLEMLLAYYSLYGKNWDPAKPSLEDFDFFFNDYLKHNGSPFPTTIG